MKKLINICLSIVLLLSFVTTALAQEIQPFTDEIGSSNSEISSAKSQADILNRIGLFQGTEKGYELERPVTRAEAVTMVLRIIGEENRASQSVQYRKFSDVKDSHWALANIEYAAAKGYINGTSETTFEPDGGVTGKEFVKMLLTAMGYQGITIDNAYESGINLALLDDDYTRLAVSTDSYPLIRNDVAAICYSALFVQTPDGRALKDLLIKKGIINEQELNSLISAELAGNTEDFAWCLNGYMPTNENYMFSPLSIKMALAMAAVGADGETKEEILKTLNIENLNRFNELSAQLIQEYSENEKVTLNIANSLWLNTDFVGNVDFKDSFMTAIESYYKADSKTVNNKNAVEMINNWVRNKTNHKITELISNSEFLAYIVNAIYFKGEWLKQFEERATQKSEFTNRNGKKTETDFMNMTGYFDYYENSNVRMIKLPYKDGKTSMYIALHEGKAADFDRYIEKMESRRVQISIPKFKTEFTIELTNILSQMGIQTAFNPDKAEFTNMFTDTQKKIFISNVIHKSYINVDEGGTEAAAVTGIGFDATSALTEPPIVFEANKPFTYFIRDDISGEILFVGEYAYVN